MKIEIGRLGMSPDGIEYYGKKGEDGQRVLFRWPIQIGSYVIKDVNEEDDIRLEIVREGKKHFFVGYDSRLGMVVKASLHRVHIMPVITEIICRKFKVSSRLSKIEKGHRIWIKNPDEVDEEELRKFLCRGRTVSILE